MARGRDSAGAAPAGSASGVRGGSPTKRGMATPGGHHPDGRCSDRSTRSEPGQARTRGSHKAPSAQVRGSRRTRFRHRRRDVIRRRSWRAHVLGSCAQNVTAPGWREHGLGVRRRPVPDAFRQSTPARDGELLTNEYEGRWWVNGWRFHFRVCRRSGRTPARRRPSERAAARRAAAPKAGVRLAGVASVCIWVSPAWGAGARDQPASHRALGRRPPATYAAQLAATHHPQPSALERT